MKSKAQRPTKKTGEQERSKERSARERDLQQNTNLSQNTNLPQNTVLWQNGFSRQRQSWAQDPFDPVNIIWPTKAQILLYKRIGVKTDMKKHDKKKQGMARSVSSRNHVKERKAKPKENDKRSKKRVKK